MPLGPVAEQVGLLPGHGDPARLRELLRLADRHVREVDAGHLPPLLGEPDRVAAFAAGEIERPPGRQAGRLGDEEPVRLRRPQQLAAGVAAVPVLGSHRHVHVDATGCAT